MKPNVATLAPDGSYFNLEIRRRSGEVLYVLVDVADYEKVAARRWCINSRGYVVWFTSRPNAKCYLMHRVIMGLEFGDPLQVDHINRDKLDCRRANLRIVTQAEQQQNKPNQRGGTSRFRGVHANGNLWNATAKLDGRTHHIGTYNEEISAARAADAFRLRHMPFAEPDPELARLG